MTTKPEFLKNPFSIPNLKTRTFIPEVMDSPDCDKAKLYNTLLQFSIINRYFSHIRRILKKTILADVKKRGLKSVTIADIGSGSCETAHWLSQDCASQGIKARVLCIDNNTDTLAYAKTRYPHNKNLVFIHDTAMNIGSYTETIDYCYSSHFLHHCTNAEIPLLLKIIYDKVRYSSVHNDVIRNPLWYFGFSLFGALFFHNSLASIDGRISICNGFKKEELGHFIAQAGIKENTVIRDNHIGHVYIVSKK